MWNPNHADSYRLCIPFRFLFVLDIYFDWTLQWSPVAMRSIFCFVAYFPSVIWTEWCHSCVRCCFNFNFMSIEPICRSLITISSFCQFCMKFGFDELWTKNKMKLSMKIRKYRTKMVPNTAWMNSYPTIIIYSIQFPIVAGTNRFPFSYITELNHS